MRLVVEPDVATKINRMKQRVRWQHPLMAKYGIDQTCLEVSGSGAIAGNAGELQSSAERLRADGSTSEIFGKSGVEGRGSSEAFSFLVLGDSGTSRHLRDRPQRRIAKRLLAHLPECAFILHTGDIVYLTGSSEQYPDNFIKPYREWLVGGENAHQLRYDQMVFEVPFFPVPGNHDYYDLSLTAGLLSKALSPLRRLLKRRINLDIGWHGSFQGEAYARAFLDYLQPLSPEQLEKHLQQYYTGQAATGRCLRYVPGRFTRLPNRYYQFRYGGIDFFALDSNTFNAPVPIPLTPEGKARREQMRVERGRLQAKMRSLQIESDALNMSIPAEAERATSIYAKLEQLEEQLGDIEKQLRIDQRGQNIDREQLRWLRDRLIASWRDPQAKGRVLFFHHPPYVTEKTKWFQAQTLAVRNNLRSVFDEVDAAIGESSPAGGAVRGTRPLVDLVLSGHAHCFEYLRTEQTGHSDRSIPWVVCGGSGFSLRRQRREGPILTENGLPVATSHLYLGRSGQGSEKRRPYSALKVEVTYPNGESLPRFLLRPLVAEYYQSDWHSYDLEPVVI